jgi:glycosyltransferase involved in cell wall biosynthesis
MMNHWGAGFSHTVFAMDGRYDARKLIAPHVPVNFGESPLRGWPYVRHVVRAIRADRPDVVLTYNWGAVEVTLGARLLSASPVIHLEDGFGADEASGLKLRRVLMRRAVLRGVHATLVPSRTLLDIALHQYKLPPAKVRLIPNGIDTGKFRRERDLAWRQSMGIHPDTLLFGFVGLLRPEKNLELLIRAYAAANLPASRLVLVGDGRCRQDLERLTSDLNLRERVLFAGHMPDPVRCLVAFDVFVMSSSTEQMPMALLEAMACGLPAVCTLVGDTGDLLDSRVPPAAVPPGDLSGYAEALCQMAGDAELRCRLGEANRQRCLERYTLERMASEHANLYHEAIASRA